MNERKNLNRGYRKLVVWQDAIACYARTCEVFQRLPYELKRVVSQQIACVDSVHRNIAEGYCRRSIREYLHSLNIALGSLGESVSGLHACLATGQIDRPTFDDLDSVAFKLENGLIRLVRSLRAKETDDTWQDSFMVRDANAAYGSEDNS